MIQTVGERIVKSGAVLGVKIVNVTMWMEPVPVNPYGGDRDVMSVNKDTGDLSAHLNNRSVASNRAFYGIQTARIKYPDLNINVASNIYKTAVESVLQFGCSSIHFNKGNISKLNQLQEN